MSEWRKANVEGALYFITITVVGWIDVFIRKELVARPVPCKQDLRGWDPAPTDGKTGTDRNR